MSKKNEKNSVGPNPFNGDVLTPQQFADEWSKISTLLDRRARVALKKANKYKGLNDRLSNIYIARARELYAFEHALLTCGRIVQENSVLKQTMFAMHGRLHELETKQEMLNVEKDKRN
jgi:hypothetical protein